MHVKIVSFNYQFYNRYANHQQSAKLDKDLYEKTEKKMEEMQRSSDLSWIEVQYLRKAVEVLLISRTTLMWTYAFAYYLAKNNATVLFEDNQRDLEMAVSICFIIYRLKVYLNCWNNQWILAQS